MLKNKFINFILAIISALAIWIFVTTMINPEEQRVIRDVNVQILNKDNLEERDLSIGDENKYKIQVTIKGKRSDILNLDANEISASIDVLGFSEGRNAIIPKVQVPNSVEMINISPPEFEIIVSKNGTKIIPVKIKISGDINKSLEIKSKVVVPNKIEISGKKEELEKLTAFVAEIRGSSITAGENKFDITLIPVNSKGDQVYNSDFTQNKVEVVIRAARKSGATNG
jgi:YbbR domain-containing protein